MKARLIGFILGILFLSQSSYALEDTNGTNGIDDADDTAMIEIMETELVKLDISADDQDRGDALKYTFSKPLNEKGEWQTDYGDAGEYKVSVGVSDGKTTSSQEIIVVVHKKEEAPVISSYMPKESSITIDEGQSISFQITASDVNKDELAYKWYFDDKEAGQGGKYAYKAGYEDAGDHKIKAAVSDSKGSARQEWAVHVKNVDREALLNGISDIVVTETETVGLNLPDFGKYGLSHSISKPIGNGNSWKTNYDDAGVYTVKITMKDGNFEASKTIRVTVKDKDRAPEFKKTGAVWMKEGQQVKIKLEAYDPDGDNITYIAESMPNGAKLEGNEVIWATSHDTVQKNSTIPGILDKFRVSYQSFKAAVEAESKGLKSRQTIKINVKDMNRPVTLAKIRDVKIREGEILNITPMADDPDGDRIRFFYKGLPIPYETGYDDAGIYNMTVTATDGFFDAVENFKVEIIDVNRAPVIEAIRPSRATEGKEISFEVEAYDYENDPINLSIANLPKNATFLNNVFSWTPAFDSASSDKGSKNFTFSFIASDGNKTAKQDANITVFNSNRKPRITSVSYGSSITAKANTPILFFVNATDDDNDKLEYAWRFGIFDTLNATNSIQRMFTSAGEKKLSVVVSDGKEKAKFKWKVKVA